MYTETDQLILDVPVLEDEAAAVLLDILWDLLTQVENHYGHQLRRHWEKLDALTRDPREPWKRITPSPVDPAEPLDDELNDDIPF